MEDLREQIIEVLHKNSTRDSYGELADKIISLITDSTPGAAVACMGGLDALVEVVKEIRKSDCGLWLKDCTFKISNCSDGREKRAELSKLLNKLYKAASI